jgi:hypothetical protein
VPTLRVLAASAALLTAPPAWCVDARPFSAPWWGPESEVLYLGSFGLREPAQPSDVFMGLEIRAGRFWWELHLMSGVLGAGDGSAFFYAGVLADLQLADIVHLVLSVAPGLYVAGEGHHLGFPLIFRSTGEFAFAITPSTRVGISFSHLSNGKLATPNPGVETLSLTLTFLMLPY